MHSVRGARRSAANPTAILAIILISYFVITGLPSIRAGLHLGPTTLSWVQDAHTLVFGGRRLFVIGMAIFGTASLLIGVAPTG
jgi:hypothetical protein